MPTLFLLRRSQLSVFLASSWWTPKNPIFLKFIKWYFLFVYLLVKIPFFIYIELQICLRIPLWSTSISFMISISSSSVGLRPIIRIMEPSSLALIKPSPFCNENNCYQNVALIPYSLRIQYAKFLSCFWSIRYLVKVQKGFFHFQNKIHWHIFVCK